ncbi:MAG: tetraacyldisaccharide 4'-kinase [Arenimonas sp.]
MKAALEAWLTERWYSGRPPAAVLVWIEALYRRGVQKRRAGEGAPVALPVPVIVVGNFTVGGTGKTPLCIALADHFRRRGFRPGIVTRGHGRRSREPVRVAVDTPVDDCGDEPALMFARTGVPVQVDADRVAAARALIADGCDLLLADDGLQHRRLGRDLEIEVVDGQRRYGNGHLMPAGPLREEPRPTALRVVNGPGARGGEWPMGLLLGDALSLDGAQRRPLARFGDGEIATVTGIGNPRRFFAALELAGLRVRGRAFADHHRFTARDFAGLSRPVLMTEKDAVKCRGLGLVDAWAVPVQADLPAEFFHALDVKLDALGVHANPDRKPS